MPARPGRRLARYAGTRNPRPRLRRAEQPVAPAHHQRRQPEINRAENHSSVSDGTNSNENRPAQAASPSPSQHDANHHNDCADYRAQRKAQRLPATAALLRAMRVLATIPRRRVLPRRATIPAPAAVRAVPTVRFAIAAAAKATPIPAVHRAAKSASNRRCRAAAEAAEAIRAAVRRCRCRSEKGEYRGACRFNGSPQSPINFQKAPRQKRGAFV